MVKAHRTIWLGLLVAFTAPVWGQTPADWKELQTQAKKHLVNLIKIDTSSPNPDEISAARYIYKQFNKHHIDWDIFSPVKGRANLMARLKGTDPAQKPLLLISHLDTAPVQERWTVPPFKGLEKDGNIYGLGTTDDKNYTAAYLALFTWLSKQPQQPVRDIIFLATSGEESGSETGLLWLLANHWERINPGFALTEGGGIIPGEDGPDLVFAEAATKQYMDIKITAYGTETHSSMPVENNAVYLLSQALAKVENFSTPARVTAPTRTLLNAILPLQDEDGQTTLRMLLNDPKKANRQTAAELMAQDPFFKSQLKDTINPTQLSSPQQTGATGASASAVLNVRLLPGTDPDEFFTQLQALFDKDENIVLEMLERPQTPAPAVMDGTDPLFASIEKTAQKLRAGSITVPGLSPASGESEFLRRAGIVTYGLGPNMDPLGTNTAHAADEFISETDFYNQLKFIAGVVFDFAYRQDLLPLTEPATVQPEKPALPSTPISAKDTKAETTPETN